MRCNRCGEYVRHQQEHGIDDEGDDCIRALRAALDKERAVKAAELEPFYAWGDVELRKASGTPVPAYILDEARNMARRAAVQMVKKARSSS